MEDLASALRASIFRQEAVLRSSLILNPVENVPFVEDLAVVSGPLHGLYNTDKVRSRDERLNTTLQFSGRRELEADSREIYSAWASALGAEDATLRALSGLHAHIVLFMALARPGQTVLLLPVLAGGHVSGRAILERLGLQVIDMAVDEAHMRVDADATLRRCGEVTPDFVFVDRSEGLVFEDFAWLRQLDGATAIFDASQYLTNIMCGDHSNPFSWGFDLMIASVHKNFPGPQKALIATRSRDDRWNQILAGISTYVSNMHTASTYAAGLTLARTEWLADYSHRMLRVAVSLECALRERGVPAVQRRADLPPTHHLWIREPTRERAYSTYEALESCRLLTNFRSLPYSLGCGLRLGVSAAVRLGLCEDDIPQLADLIAHIRDQGPTAALVDAAQSFNTEIWTRS